MNTATARVLGLITLVWLLSMPSSLAAQSGLTLSAGPASWDLSGTGTGTTVAIRWDRDLAHPLVFGSLAFEAGLGWFQDGQTGQGAVDLLLPEVGVRMGLVGPFALGLGVGWAIGLEDRSGDDLTVWAALGADFPVGADWSIRPEVRVRSVDPWVGTIADYAFGVRRSFR